MARFGSFISHFKAHPTDKKGESASATVSAKSTSTRSVEPTEQHEKPIGLVHRQPTAGSGVSPTATAMSATRASVPGTATTENTDSAAVNATNGAVTPHTSTSKSSSRQVSGLHGRTESHMSGFGSKNATANPTVNTTSVLAEKPLRSGSTSMALKKFFRPRRSKVVTEPVHETVTGETTTGSGPVFTHDAHNNMIVKTDQKFWDDIEGNLIKKYGNMGKMLGSGAGGSVRLIKRESDGVTFAVKEFVPRRSHESIKEYAKKCTAEFCIGSTLHHPNVIQTLDIISENNHYYEVMEYAPIDFFTVVMSGKMTRSEINCCMRQITMGVQYLHSAGLSHRDLKLDNCVVTKEGIVKLIDFGSAVVFQYPFEEDVVMAHGIVGSDPYLAPEVLTSTNKYDPQKVDIWSIAIIYCCMTLRRFPWKAPKKDDPSFSLYCDKDDVPHDYVASAKKHKLLLAERKKKIAERKKAEEERPLTEEEKAEKVDDKPAEKVDNVEKVDDKTDAKPAGQVADAAKSEAAPDTVPETAPKAAPEAAPEAETTKKLANLNLDKDTVGDLKPKKVDKVPERRQSATPKTHKTIHGPYRLMRLLPHAARPIMSRMLDTNPNTRATMDDIFADEWFNEIKYCTIDEDGNTINDPGHQHTTV